MHGPKLFIQVSILVVACRLVILSHGIAGIDGMDRMVWRSTLPFLTAMSRVVNGLRVSGGQWSTCYAGASAVGESNSNNAAGGEGSDDDDELAAGPQAEIFQVSE
jgi:hypothetical protein